MDQPEKEKIIEQWLAGSLTEDEVLKSISREELDQYKIILGTVDNWVPEGSDSVASQLQDVLAGKKETKVVSIGRRAWITGIAASIALIAAISFIFFGDQPQEFYAENENMEILLPDGTTTVILSPGSSLSYKKFRKKSRKVKVQGRAYFDVTEKGAFEVEYEGGSISVLGTQFEVVHFKDVFEAACFEGSVEVHYRGKRARMRPKDKVVYARGSLSKTQTNQGRPGWLGNEETFENDQLTKVIRVIESRYKVNVTADSVDLDRRFTGTIPKNDLQQACRKVFASLGINYKIDGDRIILTP